MKEGSNDHTIKKREERNFRWFFYFDFFGTEQGTAKISSEGGGAFAGAPMRFDVRRDFIVYVIHN